MEETSARNEMQKWGDYIKAMSDVLLYAEMFRQHTIIQAELEVKHGPRSREVGLWENKFDYVIEGLEQASANWDKAQEDIGVTGIWSTTSAAREKLQSLPIDPMYWPEGYS